MKFEATALGDALGTVLGHNVHDGAGRRVLRKGRALGAEEIALLRELGRDRVFAARLEPDDVDEDEAARRVGEAVAGPGLTRRGSTTGRVNFHARELGVLRVDAEALDRLNDCEGVTLATRPNNSVAPAGKMVATTKILPYALPEETVAAAERVAAAPVIRVDPLAPRRAALIVSGTVAQGQSAGRERLVAGFARAFGERLESLNAELAEVRFVPLHGDRGVEGLTAAAARLAPTTDLLVLAGETAIQDRHDLAPSAIEAAGGTVICYGAPVDPGNLLLLAELEGTPVLGAPGCARSPKRNIVDLVLPRLLVGDRLTRRDIASLGHGGLLEDVPERPLPRRRIERSVTLHPSNRTPEDTA